MKGFHCVQNTPAATPQLANDKAWMPKLVCHLRLQERPHHKKAYQLVLLTMGVAREYLHVRLVYHHILDVIECQHRLPHHLLGRHACLDGAHLQLPDLRRLEP
ncbi:hypothetical protein PC116_g18045 [Phytophthora cactorum]|uniref:Uncharacterized protein n=1 Tax=Phytophthora cactorum TaxID=29920 RepID=A0A8T1KAT7_9STRA|nr:hypothetical protein PC114_g15215 [Phytophthora cactorum]KAG2921957.1 hypothetical protein PC117_g16093 [Phytophthora cactorum]KAG2988155.1 hypothetical protein PC119_g19540 [Phytophthora cactorum]KAG3153548.1 hypothetical protein C6341_g15901 [Phytophthora cactorum]KAG4233773.1 hypothetical protein PC116_g18045 [Phytophthora cactorum]